VERGKRKIKLNEKRKRGDGWVGGGQKILWTLMKRMMIFQRVRMMRNNRKRSNL
jgi:hypothetical protein